MPTQVSGREFTSILQATLTAALYGQNLHNCLILARSRDAIGHMTIRLAIDHFLVVILWNQAR